MILKLDDIGHDSHKPTFDIVSWALYKKIPISIGTIGRHLFNAPAELILILRTGIELGMVEIWNHGFSHIRYDNATIAQLLDDLVRGHEAIRDTLNIDACGFGFPYNKFNDAALFEVRQRFENYFVYEVDFPGYRQFTPEYNVFADGQPNLMAFHERLARAGADQSIIVQAHPPRWSDGGIDNLIQCVEYAISNGGFVCVTAEQALIDDRVDREVSVLNQPLKNLVNGAESMVSKWRDDVSKYAKQIGGFESYLVPKFESESVRNCVQISRRLFPFKPKKILDVRSGFGNWSIGFALSGGDVKLTLNETNAFFAGSLRDVTKELSCNDNIVVDERNLLALRDNELNSFGGVDFVVCGSFNYLDPISLFKLANRCVEHEGRLLLVVQTEGFDDLRLDAAVKNKNRSAVSEVFASKFSMLMRREYGVVTTGVRHLFNRREVSLLAHIFDFDLVDTFIPMAELGKKSPTYECLIFKRGLSRRKGLLDNKEWLGNYRAEVERIFGERALREIDLPSSTGTEGCEFPFNSDWSARSGANLPAMTVEIKGAIVSLGNGLPVGDHIERVESATDSTSMSEFVSKFRDCCRRIEM
ncbi:polysaccharide deacetylase family protein [Burkholderia sp. A9]|uniref:polysaccharide deacetylase family protein n=1 Tax=Burkholderia sp. A9 TaxID=1365108 RepID=UPI00137917D2|nr:polysaccharide deacetylase family protein [Burkholderia sp. A9]